MPIWWDDNPHIVFLRTRSRAVIELSAFQRTSVLGRVSAFFDCTYSIPEEATRRQLL